MRQETARGAPLRFRRRSNHSSCWRFTRAIQQGEEGGLRIESASFPTKKAEGLAAGLTDELGSCRILQYPAALLPMARLSISLSDEIFNQLKGIKPSHRPMSQHIADLVLEAMNARERKANTSKILQGSASTRIHLGLG